MTHEQHHDLPATSGTRARLATARPGTAEIAGQELTEAELDGIAGGAMSIGTRGTITTTTTTRPGTHPAGETALPERPFQPQPVPR